jgi:hypothetical protein
MEGLNFSIQDTLELGIGDQQLLSDLYEPETVTSSPREVTKITEPKTSEEVKPATSLEATPSAKDEELNSFLELKDEKNDVVHTKNAKLTEEPNDNIFSNISKTLLEQGVFQLDEEEAELEISTPEAFLERFQQEKQKGATEIINNFIGKFGEDYQNAFQSIYVKGVDPKEYFSTFNKIEDFTSLNMSEERNQELVVKTALIEQGYDEDDVATEIERLRNYGDLETVANKHHKVLVKKETAKLQELEQKAQRDLEQKHAFRAQYEQNVKNILNEKLKTKEFDGVPLNVKLAEEVEDYLVTDKYKLTSGETITEFDKDILDLKRPENHIQKVKMGLILKLLKKDPNLSTIQKAGITKETNTLFRDLVNQKVSGKSTETTKSTNNAWNTSL